MREFQENFIYRNFHIIFWTEQFKYVTVDNRQHSTKLLQVHFLHFIMWHLLRNLQQINLFSELPVSPPASPCWQNNQPEGVGLETHPHLHHHLHQEVLLSLLETVASSYKNLENIILAITISNGRGMIIHLILSLSKKEDKLKDKTLLTDSGVPICPPLLAIGNN